MAACHVNKHAIHFKIPNICLVYSPWYLRSHTMDLFPGINKALY